MTTLESNAPAIPLACVPGAIPQAERSAHFELLARISARSRDKRELPNGYAYRFESADFDDLARWMTNERRCCPFLRFVVELEPDGGAIWIRLTGPAGTREFLDVEFPQMGRAQPH
jgi:hypothetical protein